MERIKKLFHSNLKIHNEIIMESTQEAYSSMGWKSKIKIKEESRDGGWN